MFGAAADPSLDAGIVLGAGTWEEPLAGEGLDDAGDVGRGQLFLRPRVRDALGPRVAGYLIRHERDAPSGRRCWARIPPYARAATRVFREGEVDMTSLPRLTAAARRSGAPTGPHGGAGWADTGRVQHFLADHEFAVTAVMSGLIVTLAVAAIWSIFR